MPQRNLPDTVLLPNGTPTNTRNVERSRSSSCDRRNITNITIRTTPKKAAAGGASRDASPRPQPKGILKTPSQRLYVKNAVARPIVPRTNSRLVPQTRASTSSRLSAPNSPAVDDKENALDANEKFYTPVQSFVKNKQWKSNTQLSTARSNECLSDVKNGGRSVVDKSTDDKQERVQIAVRIRPDVDPNGDSKSADYLRIDIATKTITVNEDDRAPKSFQFDHIFTNGENTSDQSQQSVYNEIGAPMLQALLAGRQCALLAYGQTGSGKTYSVSGTPDAPGILDRFCRDLFTQLRDEIATGAASVDLSYYEIYKEKVYDLLVVEAERRRPSHIDSLSVREGKTGPYIDLLTVKSVGSHDDVMLWLRLGSRRRATAATVYNDRSSRSHAIAVLDVRRRRQVHYTGSPNGLTMREVVVTSRVHIVDLAGSERTHLLCQSTPTAGGSGEQRFTESININKSLMQLNMVIRDRAEQCRNASDTHVNYRDSLLTWLLKDALNGNACTYLLATISAAHAHRTETVSTLRMAGVARQMTITANNADSNTDADLIDKLLRRIAVLEAEKETAIKKAAEPVAQSQKDTTITTEMKEKLENLHERLLAVSEENDRRLVKMNAHQNEVDKCRQQLRLAKEFMCASGVWLTNEMRQSCSSTTDDTLLPPRKHSFVVQLTIDPAFNVAYDLTLPTTVFGSNRTLSTVVVPDLQPKHCSITQNSRGKSLQLQVLTENHQSDDCDVFINGDAMHEKCRKLNHLDRICVGGDVFFLVFHKECMPENAERYAMELVQSLARYNYGSARAELLTHQLPILEARLVGEAKTQLEAEKCELLNELKEKLQNANNKIKSYEIQLEEKEKSTTKMFKNSEEVDRLKREIRRLKQDQQITSGVLDDLEEELRPILLNPSTILSPRNPVAPIIPTNSTPLDLAELQTKVDRANLHLKTLEKDHLYKFTLELHGVGVEDELNATNPVNIIRLVHHKNGLCTILDRDEFLSRADELRSIYVDHKISQSLNDDTHSHSIDERLQSILYNGYDLWTSVHDRRQCQSLVFNAMHNAIQSTAQRMGRTTSDVRRSIMDENASTTKRRRSTLSTFLDSSRDFVSTISPAPKRNPDLSTITEQGVASTELVLTADNMQYLLNVQSRFTTLCSDASVSLNNYDRLLQYILLVFNYLDQIGRIDFEKQLTMANKSTIELLMTTINVLCVHVRCLRADESEESHLVESLRTTVNNLESNAQILLSTFISGEDVDGTAVIEPIIVNLTHAVNTVGRIRLHTHEDACVITSLWMRKSDCGKNEKTIAAHEFTGCANAIREQLYVYRSGKFETLCRNLLELVNLAEKSSNANLLFDILVPIAQRLKKVSSKLAASTKLDARASHKTPMHVSKMSTPIKPGHVHFGPVTLSTMDVDSAQRTALVELFTIVQRIIVDNEALFKENHEIYSQLIKLKTLVDIFDSDSSFHSVTEHF